MGCCSFEVPSLQHRKSALGGTGGIPFLLQRVLRFSETWFEPVPEPRMQDWLARHKELMQTFSAFRTAWEEHKGTMGITEDRNCIHLLSIGPQEPPAELLRRISDGLSAFFAPLRVAVLRPKTDGAILSGKRPRSVEARRASSKPRRLETTEILASLAGGLRSDSVLTIALTASPLQYLGSKTTGATDWKARVGVFNIREAACDTVSPLIIERSFKMVAHQVMHMMGILHCCYYRCLMNGASNLEEEDNRPPYICAVCLKKLHLVVGFDPLDRYSRLSRFWAANASHQTALWYETRIRVVRSTFGSISGPLAPAPRHQRPTSRLKSEAIAVVVIPQSSAQCNTGEGYSESDNVQADDEVQKAWWRSHNQSEAGR